MTIRDARHRNLGPLPLIVLWWVWCPVVYLAFAGFDRLFAGHPWRRELDQFMMANFWSRSILWWVT